MAPTQRMELRQSQALVMTPQLQQAIKLLQLSNLELAQYVESELEQNPLLERDEGELGGAEPAGTQENGSREETRALASGPAEDGVDPAAIEAGAAEGTGTWDAEEEPGLAFGGRASRSGGDFESSGDGLEQMASRETNLREHLLTQLHLDLPDPTDRIIGLHLIDMLDESGLLVGDLAELGQRLGCPVARIEATLARVQQCDPPGIFARNLAECLALQLGDQGRLTPAMQALLDNLDLLARRDRAGLMRRLGVEADELARMVAEIRCLNPKPALAFDVSPAQPVTPDILMSRGPEDGWILELNAETLPRVLVNHRYYARVRSNAKDKSERDYLTERFHAANWLVKALHQRAATILKVASEIVRQQDAFFRHGVQHLRPLIRRDIAAAVGMHESTVSRVTSNKYIASPRGVYELKFFFSAAISDMGGGATHSAAAVRSRIGVLIQQEAADRVLSDDQIADILRREGIDIARRTVAKYRESMRIPSSAQRRREKTLQI